MKDKRRRTVELLVRRVMKIYARRLVLRIFDLVRLLGMTSKKSDVGLLKGARSSDLLSLFLVS